jgi:hypothetical protein
MHVSGLKEPRNPLSYRHLSFHFVSSSRCFFWLLKIHRARFARVSVSETENSEVLNGAFLMTQNVAERVSRLRSRNRRFPWLFPSLNLSRSFIELATVRRRIERLNASSGNRICLFQMF